MRRPLPRRGLSALVTRMKRLHDDMRRDPADIEAHISRLGFLIVDAELLEIGGDSDASDRR